MTQRLRQLDHVSFNLSYGRVLFDYFNHTLTTCATGIDGPNGYVQVLALQAPDWSKTG
jgi:hypothetical protein